MSSWTESIGLTHMIVILQIWLFTFFIIKLRNHVLFTWTTNYLTFWQLYSSSSWFKVSELGEYWQVANIKLHDTRYLDEWGCPHSQAHGNDWEDHLQDRYVSATWLPLLSTLESCLTFHGISLWSCQRSSLPFRTVPEVACHWALSF